ncbi:MAG: polyprenyl synthetase family protein [Candidatus Berkiella sp.]
MPLQAITQLVTADLLAVNDTILQSLESQVEVIKQIGHYLIRSGGKRIRPLVVLLCSRACQATGQAPISMAAIIEFIHTATLLHDDVVDGSKLRRGQPTANHVWDNSTAVLVGDFLYSRSFQMMVALNNMASMRILADATNVIAEGEVLQLAHRHQPNVSEEQYLRVIHYKTATLFEAAASLGAVMGNQSTDVIQSLAQYGLQLGMAFQLADDVLDYQATNSAWGKNIGNDLAEGKATLPLIYAMKHAPSQQAQIIRSAIEKGSIEDIGLVQEAIVSSGAIDYTFKVAKEAVQKAQDALLCLPASPYREALAELAAFAIIRGN